MANHFPIPSGNQADWSSRDWQAAANHYFYEIMGVDRSVPNYRPTLSLLESAHAHANRRARALRSAGK